MKIRSTFLYRLGKLQDKAKVHMQLIKGVKMQRMAGTYFCMCCLLAVSSTTACAAPAVYSGTDISGSANSDAAAQAFDNASPPTEFINFESSPVGFFSTLQVAPDVVLTLTGADSGFSSGISNDNDHIDEGFNTTPGGSNYFRFVPDISTGLLQLRFDFSTPVRSFGAYFTGLENNYNGNFSYQFNDGTTQSVSIPKSLGYGDVFVGFTDSGAQMSSITVDEAGPFDSRDVAGMDDVRFQEVPEPAATDLAAFAFLILFSRRPNAQ